MPGKYAAFLAFLVMLATPPFAEHGISYRATDESGGEPLRLRAATASAMITARLDPPDHLHERGLRVDFVGRGSVEKPAAFRTTLERFLAR